MKKYALLFVLAALNGCTTNSSHTEGDREVQDQTEKAGQVTLDSIQDAKSALEEGNALKAKTILEIGYRAGQDVVANMKQQKDVHGGPKEAKPYSPPNSEAARARSTSEHQSTPWGTYAMYGASALLGIAGTIFGMPWLSSLLPQLTGKIGVMAKTGVQIIAAARQKAEANGGTIHATDILAIAKEKNVAAGIQKIVKRHADAHEAAMGHKFNIKLATPAEEAEEETAEEAEESTSETEGAKT